MRFTNKEIHDKLELVSDDFSSTFVIQEINDNGFTIANMLRGPEEFQEVAEIINKHYGTSKVIFTKTNQLGADNYDIYIIEVEFIGDI